MILNQRGLFCQITIAWFALVFIAGCATKDIERGVEIQPVYNALHPNALEARPSGEVEANLFFDPPTHVPGNDRHLNVVIVTPKDSKQGYELDLRSGSRWRRRYHCAHDDIWNKFSGTLDVPPFSVAVVPRVLDALSEAQEAFVFGDQKLWGGELHRKFFEVRVIGGVLRQVCREYPCKLRERWLSNMQLIAVNPQDPRFKDVHNLEQLKKKVNWDKAVAWMQNGFGVTQTGMKAEPVYRVTGEIEASAALNYLFKKDREIDFVEQKKMVNSCHALYNHLWQENRKLRAAAVAYDELRQDKGSEQKDKDLDYADSERLRLLRQQREVERLNRRVKLQEARAQANFGKAFRAFHQEYASRYKTCMRFVRPASHVRDNERFWFFAYVDLFMGMEELGWEYSCSRKSWGEGNYRRDGLRKGQVELDASCTTEELDVAFDTAVTVMKREASLKRPHMQFIAYDSGAGGSHQKVYGWVYVDGKELLCKNSSEQEKLAQHQQDLFPNQLRWKKFSVMDERSFYDIIE